MGRQADKCGEVHGHLFRILNLNYPKISIPTSHKILCISFTEMKELKLYGDKVAVTCENCMNHINTLYRRN
jgi:hypothetical protein